MKNRKILDITYVAMSAALMAVCSWIAIPFTVAVTLQTFAVLLISALFGAKRATLAVAVYLVLGAVGLPVFSNFNGGLGHLTGATGGYIFGFLATALIVGLLSKTKMPFWASMTLGVLACYFIGTAWYAFLYSDGKNAWEIAAVCVLPFVPFDALKITAAAFATKRLKRADLIK